MKKLLCIAICVMILCMAACANQNPSNGKADKNGVPVSVEYILEREGNSSTGYQWFATVADASVLKVQINNNQEVIEPSITITNGTSSSSSEKSGTTSANSDSSVVGGPEKYSIILTGQKEGRTKLCLDYKRSWESTEADVHEVYKATVSLKDNQLIVSLEKDDQ